MKIVDRLNNVGAFEDLKVGDVFSVTDRQDSPVYLKVESLCTGPPDDTVYNAIDLHEGVWTEFTAGLRVTHWSKAQLSLNPKSKKEDIYSELKETKKKNSSPKKKVKT